MAKKYWGIGEAYLAEDPADFWRKWNPNMHRSLNCLYKKLGGIDKHITAVATTFLVSGAVHDLAFKSLETVTGHDFMPNYLWTLSFAVWGAPVVVDKYLLNKRAKEHLLEDLDSEVKKYGQGNSTEVLRAFSSKLSDARIEELSSYFTDYGKNRKVLANELFKDTHRGLMAVMRERKEKRKSSFIPLSIKTLLTVGYIYGTFNICSNLLSK